MAMHEMNVVSMLECVLDKMVTLVRVGTQLHGDMCVGTSLLATHQDYVSQ